MSAKLIDGNALAIEASRELRRRALCFSERHGRPVHLAVILVGDHGPSWIYVRNKRRAAAQASIHTTLHHLCGDVSTPSLVELVDRLNRDEQTDGILLQLPLPAHLEPGDLLDRIDPAKDVDGLNAMHAGWLAAGRPAMRPCTPLACMRMLDAIGCDPRGKNAVLLGASNLVGKPAGLMLLERGASPVFCHVQTRDAPELVRCGDIVVVAVGKPELLRGEWLKPGAIVLDVGINRVEGGKLLGDAHFDSVAPVASWLSPVPGGVGPMTVVMLLSNTVDAAERRTASRETHLQATADSSPPP